MTTNPFYTSILLIIIGILLLGVGVFLFFKQRTRIRESIVVEGTVIELRLRRARGKYVQVKTAEGVKFEKKYLYVPLIRFRTKAGKTIQFAPSIAMRPAPCQVGDRVNVLYHPDHPREAQIDRFTYLWFNVLMLISVGFSTTGMGVLLLILQ